MLEHGTGGKGNAIFITFLLCFSKKLYISIFKKIYKVIAGWTCGSTSAIKQFSQRSLHQPDYWSDTPVRWLHKMVKR